MLPHLPLSFHSASISAGASHIDDDLIEALLRKYREKFINIVDAHAIVNDLLKEKIIDESLAHRIEKESAKDVASGMIYDHLVRQADGGHLDTVCSVMMSKESFPRMRKWAEKMRSELYAREWCYAVYALCVCVCVWGGS